MSRIAPRLAGTAALAALAALGLAGSAFAETAKLPPKWSSMSAEDFQARTQVLDDHLDTETVISTEKALRHTRGVFKTPWNDNHLLAVIDKRTGVARFEVRQTLQYPGLYRGYSQVSYQTAQWPLGASLGKIRDNAGSCALVEAGEVCFEEVAFAIDEAHLRAIAVRYQTAAPGQWAFKFKAADDEHRTAIAEAEVVGLLRAVDDYKRGLTHLEAQADPLASAG